MLPSQTKAQAADTAALPFIPDDGALPRRAVPEKWVLPKREAGTDRLPQEWCYPNCLMENAGSRRAIRPAGLPRSRVLGSWFLTPQKKRSSRQSAGAIGLFERPINLAASGKRVELTFSVWELGFGFRAHRGQASTRLKGMAAGP